MMIFGVLATIVMGLSLGVLGGGGSILTVPILVYLFRIDPVLATGYSLFLVGLTSLLGAILAWKKGQVDLKTGVLFAVPSFIAVYLTRAALIPALPDVFFEAGSVRLTKSVFLMLFFAVLMLTASISMIRERKDRPQKLEVKPWLRASLIGLEGTLVGVVTGLVGAGGGFLIIPALVVLVGLPMRLAVGTSLAIIAVKSLIGVLGDLQSQGDQFDGTFLIGLALVAALGLLIGRALAPRIPESVLKKSFGFFVLAMGFVIFADQLFQIL